MSQPFVVRVHSLASLDQSLERGVPVEPRRPVPFGRETGYLIDVDKGATVRVPMLLHDRTTSQSVSKFAGVVHLDEWGRPWLRNRSRIHDLFVRRWPHSLPEKVAKDTPEAHVDPNNRMLTEGWWWVSSSRGNTPGWVLISVERTLQRRRPRNAHDQPDTAAESVQTLDPDARPIYRLPEELIDLFVNYFIDWFAMPPAAAPRLRTGPQVNDSGDNGRNRILTALKAEIRRPTGRRGLLNPELLIKAVDEGKLTFRTVYESLTARDLTRD